MKLENQNKKESNTQMSIKEKLAITVIFIIFITPTIFVTYKLIH
jgi:hypothetical protein